MPRETWQRKKNTSTILVLLFLNLNQMQVFVLETRITYPEEILDIFCSPAIDYFQVHNFLLQNQQFEILQELLLLPIQRPAASRTTPPNAYSFLQATVMFGPP